MAKVLSLKLDDEERERLAQLAERKNRTPHFLMRTAVMAFIDREEKRMSFREEAEAAWTDFTETGLHLTLDDIDAWAASGETKLPEWRR